MRPNELQESSVSDYKNTSWSVFVKVLKNNTAGLQFKHTVVWISDGISEPIPSATVIRANHNNVTSSLYTSCPTLLKSILANTESIQQV